MSSLLRLVAKLPIPTGVRLAWKRALLDRVYTKDIAQARKHRNAEEIESLTRDHCQILDRHDEEEDVFITKKLLAKASRLRVPIPDRYKEGKIESEYWYESYHTGKWSLTNHGVAALREEIRRELKARHELRSQWIVWLSVLTGVIGAITGLVALLKS